jgi:pimeloyl-ACP methyl ester carboxylesterase
MIIKPTTLRPVCRAPASKNGRVMSNAATITVSDLGTSTIGYQLGKAYDASLPTLVMVNSFTTSVEQFRPQFADEKLTRVANLLAIEPYGDGQSHATYEQFTYWDSAIANLQVIEALEIPDAFVLGTSQGAWITARMATSRLAP